MNMHIWNLSRRNPRLLAGVLIESSCQLKTRRVLQWRVLFSAAGESEQRRGGRTWRWCETPEAGGSNELFFFFFWTGRTRSVAGGPAGAKVEAAYFIHLGLSAWFVEKSMRGNSGRTALGEESIPLNCVRLMAPSSPAHLPARWNGRLGESVWSVTPSLSCKTRCNQGLGVGPWKPERVNQPSGKADADGGVSALEGPRRFDVEESEKEKAKTACKSEWGLWERSNSSALCEGPCNKQYYNGVINSYLVL